MQATRKQLYQKTLTRFQDPRVSLFLPIHGAKKRRKGDNRRRRWDLEAFPGPGCYIRITAIPVKPAVIRRPDAATLGPLPCFPTAARYTRQRPRKIIDRVRHHPATDKLPFPLTLHQ